MRKALLAIVAIGSVLAVTGCSSLNTNDAAVAATPTIQKQFTADIVPQSKKVSGEATVHNLFGFISWGVSKFADDAFVSTTSSPVVFATANTVAKQGATFNACESAKADYILGAKYQIDTKDYFVYKKVKCTVTGTPANLKGFK